MVLYVADDHRPSALATCEDTQVFFEELQQGMKIEGAVEVTEELILQCSRISRDYNDVHRKIAHGAILALLVSGVISEFLGSSSGRVPAAVEEWTKFLSPIPVGGTFVVKGTVLQLLGYNNRRGKVIFEIDGFDGDGKLVLQGCYKVLVPRRNRSALA